MSFDLLSLKQSTRQLHSTVERLTLPLYGCDVNGYSLDQRRRHTRSAHGRGRPTVGPDKISTSETTAADDVDWLPSAPRCRITTSIAAEQPACDSHSARETTGKPAERRHHLRVDLPACQRMRRPRAGADARHVTA